MAWEIHQQSLLPLDSVTHLPGRVEFQAFLNHEHGKSIRENLALGLLLINPDDFGMVNHRLGKRGGETGFCEKLRQNCRPDSGRQTMCSAMAAQFLPW